MTDYSKISDESKQKIRNNLADLTALKAETIDTLVGFCYHFSPNAVERMKKAAVALKDAVEAIKDNKTEEQRRTDKRRAYLDAKAKEKYHAQQS